MLSYEYIATILPKYFKENVAKGKIVIAHLGNGASCCAINNLQSIATSMGFTALEGLMMGTRCGNIDPGVILYLLEEKKLTVKETTKLLYSGSGLLGVSGVSSDVRELEASKDPRAKDALELFCYRAAREMLAVCTMLGGLDGIVFTAGIGEHSAFVRAKICEWLSWLGVKIDQKANQNNNQIISTDDSKIIVGVIPTNEELMIAKDVVRLTK
jgi:acetate kinase